MKLESTIQIIATEDSPYFGAYKVGSLTRGNPVVLFNIKAVISALQDTTEPSPVFRDLVLQVVSHEVIHSLQEWLEMEFDELQVEKILGAYNPDWNVFEAEGDRDNQTQFGIEEFLDRLEEMQPDKTGEFYSAAYMVGFDTLRNQIKELFRPFVLWREAEARHQSEVQAEVPKTLGEVLKQARFQKRLTLRQVQKQSGISNSYLCQLESGQVSNPSGAKLYILAKVYDISFEELIKLTLKPKVNIY